jgi:hypothetical protein
MSDPARNKEELLKVFEEVKQEAVQLKATTSDIMQHCQMAADIAGPLHDYYAQVPADQLSVTDLTLQKESWQALMGATRKARQALTGISTFGALATSATNTSVSGVLMHFQSFPMVQHSQPEQMRNLVVLKSNVTKVLERFPLCDEVRAEISRLQIDTGFGGSQSAPALLDQARSLVDAPTFGSGAMGGLVSLRECIERCMAELTRRLPTSEKAKGWRRKTELLGKQCGKDGLTAKHFETIGIDGDKTNDFLSEAKQGEISRSEAVDRFNKGLLFLRALLTSIDESKLRPK